MVRSPSSKIVEQIGGNEEGDTPEVSKLNDSALDKKQGDQTRFSPKQDSKTLKMDLIYPLIFAITLFEGLLYRVINSSILQELFSSIPKCS